MNISWQVKYIERITTQQRKILYYCIVDLLITIILCAIVLYYRWYGVIVTYFASTQALAQVNQVTAVSNNVFSIVDYYFILMFIDIVMLAIYLIRKRIDRKLTAS
ncbi:MAG TPA: hypothetical protein IAA29_05500 [Candidatus Paenibacillus intestinavium]|nr:hypothetical protein [Candidatus Paenibacillus intestinavium]